MPESPANGATPGPARSSRIPRLLAVGGLVVVAALAVGAASRPHSVDVALTPPEIGGLTVLLLLVFAGVAGLVIGRNFVAAWTRQPDVLDPAAKRSRIPRVVSMLIPVFILAIAVFIRTWLNGQDKTPNRHNNLPAPVIPADTTPITGGDLGLFVACVVIGLVAALVAAVFFRRHIEPALPPAPPEGIAAILDEGLDALLGENDPRRAVIAAWVAMERAMARQGWARRPAEAPTEYLSRVLGVAPARAGDLDRLVALYQVARFSEHTVTPGMREEALEAVRRLRADLQEQAEARAHADTQARAEA